MGWGLWKIQKVSKGCFGIQIRGVFTTTSYFFIKKLGKLGEVSPNLSE